MTPINSTLTPKWSILLCLLSVMLTWPLMSSPSYIKQISHTLTKIYNFHLTYHEYRCFECIAVLVFDSPVLSIFNFIQLDINLARSWQSKQCALRQKIRYQRIVNQIFSVGKRNSHKRCMWSYSAILSLNNHYFPPSSHFTLYFIVLLSVSIVVENGAYLC